MPESPQKDVTEFFYHLLPQQILEAVEEMQVRCTGRLLQLNSMENRVYEAEIEAADEAPRFEHFRVPKFYRPGRWSKEQIEEEHGFLLELKAQDIPVVAPLLFPNDKKTLHRVSDQEIWFTVFPKCAGRTLDELDDKQLERIGRLVGRLHAAGSTSPFKHRLTLNQESYGRANLNYLANQHCIPPEMEKRFLEVGEIICKVYEQRAAGIKIQRIHGDLHGGNILWDKDYCFLVDFDDSLNGPCVQDLWLLCPGRDEATEKAWEKLLLGYEQFRKFDRRELVLIEPLRTLRMIHFSAWIAKRYSDPAFQRIFPAFGNQQYWRDQLTALEEQREILTERL